VQEVHQPAPGGRPRQPHREAGEVREARGAKATPPHQERDQSVHRGRARLPSGVPEGVHRVQSRETEAGLAGQQSQD
jgi:hypothetical protein